MMDFDAFIKDIKDNNWNVFGVELYQKGEPVNHWGDTFNIHEIYSATKGITSIAVGIAYDEGLIDFDKSILEYLPKDRVKSLSKKQYERFEKISVRRLLTMSVADFPFRPEGEDWLEYSLACDINPDIIQFNYSNIPVYIICVALTNIFGCDLGEFIEKRIFAPMDITSFEYGRSPEGYFYGASNMLLSVHDLSKFALLLYNKGVYNGIRIVSEEYVDLATSVQMMNREGGYGFYFWRYRSGYSINGKWKQKCYIIPKQEIIITYLSHIEDDSQDLKCSMEKHIFGIGDKEEKAFKRIAEMEELFDKISSGKGTARDVKKLDSYYTGADWRFDFELDEAGLLPANLKHGVLSEDGIYNLLEKD